MMSMEGRKGGREEERGEGEGERERGEGKGERGQVNCIGCIEYV